MKVVRLIAVMLTLLLPCPVSAETLIGHVVAVHDGDTLTILTSSNRQIKVRLAEIDAPELHQAYGQKSKLELASLVFDRDVTVRKEATDRYGRTIGILIIDGHDINSEMIAIGAAWVYKKYLHDNSLLILQAQAMNDHRGIWALQSDQIEAPWEYRRKSAAQRH